MTSARRRGFGPKRGRRDSQEVPRPELWTGRPREAAEEKEEEEKEEE